MSRHISIRRALISVSDKMEVIGIAQMLSTSGAEIFSTGGTSSFLEQNNISVTEISSYTGFPEIMGGRVKTLHPKIFGGILGRRGEDDKIMSEKDILPIDLVITNLYPFKRTIDDVKHNVNDAIENIDIGGSTLIRAAAKNFKDVAVIVDSRDYPLVMEELRQFNGISYDTRLRLAQKAFAYTAHYDDNIAEYFNMLQGANKQLDLPLALNGRFKKKMDLRYGENPHQKAALYQWQVFEDGLTVATAKQLQGKKLSFNNLMDTDMAANCVQSFSETACVIVKHANPCGVAVAYKPLLAYQKAFETDSTSAFGGIIAFNRCVDQDVAEAIVHQQFVEVVIAPKITNSALECFARKQNVRILQSDCMQQSKKQSYDFKCINGGILIQEQDTQNISVDQLQVVTKRQPSKEELDDLLFAWKVVKFVKSNAIVYAKNGQTIGIGAGQMSRIYSARIAILKAEESMLELNGSVMASDAFFPFSDCIEAAAEVGVNAIIQPGGSINDSEVIKAADEAGLAMVFTRIRHFRH